MGGGGALPSVASWPEKGGAPKRLILLLAATGQINASKQQSMWASLGCNGLGAE